MNSSTLRRLAADHASLRTKELPPYYFYSPAEATNSDDLTQLTIFLTGPRGTPYSQGAWKLLLKIPDDYPKSPPRASFRTKIWHPNVEENSGSVCVDTLKKDWEPRLTLRDVLITISCLLIQPNPDSALNATAGQLLQEDFDHFAKQAKLMTSIHANIPPSLREAALAAQRRGEAPGEVQAEDHDQRPNLKGKSTSYSSVIMKTLPERITSPQSAPTTRVVSTASEVTEDEDESSASKENDPTLSPTAVPIQSPRRPNLMKRPLSDLPCPTEEEVDQMCTSPSEQNIANNVSQCNPEAFIAIHNVESNNTGRSLRDTSTNVTIAKQDDVDLGRSAKRICSDEAKENAREDYNMTAPALSTVTNLKGVPAKIQSTSIRKASAPSVLGAGGGKASKARIGLRRL